MEPKRRKLRDNRAGGRGRCPSAWACSRILRSHWSPVWTRRCCPPACPLASGERPQGFPGDYSAAHTLNEEDYDWFLHLTGDVSRDLRRQVFHTPPLYYGRPQRAHSLRPAHFRRDIAVERDGCHTEWSAVMSAVQLA